MTTGYYLIWSNKMVTVGLVGEDPNDTCSIKNLLASKYKDRVRFQTLARGIRGCHLDTQKLKNSLKVEL